jgi:hypothetical protein
MTNAADISTLYGAWTLHSFVMVDEATRAREPLYGSQPKGRLILLPEGRMMAVITAEGRELPNTDQDRAAAFTSMLAYSGIYKVSGNTFVTDVDLAWNEAWVGTEQHRIFEIEGDRLTIVSLPRPALNFGSRMMHGELVWERETPRWHSPTI